MKSGYVRSAGRKVLTFALVLAVSVGILGGCVPSSKRPKNLKSVSYRLKWLPNANYIDGYVAQSKGYFAEQGLSCTVRPGGPDLDSIKSVASGSDDFGVTGADQLIMARSHGIDIVAIAAFFQGSPVCYIARNDSGIRTPKDFRGKRIGVKPGTNTETEYRAMMMKLGIRRLDVKEVPVKFDMSPFYQGRVDVWPGYESNELLQARAAGMRVRAILSRENGIATYGNVLFTRRSLLRNNPDLVRRFVAAVIRGWLFACENPDQAVGILVAAEPKLSKQKELQALRSIIPLVTGGNASKGGVGFMTERRWRESQQVLIDAGILSKPVPTSGLFTTDFVPATSKSLKH